GSAGGRDALGVLFDERHVPPGVRAERARVVVGGAEQFEVPVGGDVVPLLAGDLAGLAADADGGVGEEALARVVRVPVGITGGVGRPGKLTHQFLLTWWWSVWPVRVMAPRRPGRRRLALPGATRSPGPDRSRVRCRCPCRGRPAPGRTPRSRGGTARGGVGPAGCRTNPPWTPG